ncbi:MULTISPECIES: SusC/RagA family TonB-linked outer membrane protein [Spirosoma]|uniref:TonB-dependent receptor n=1 Tax=Spirosoma sordidisoli TaxID=2502893 RepID=A0A4Q2UNZ8_9BACT|nr:MULTISPECIES: TonB-dependent receptor [Spirosoma]RYC70582.1 TonB-dependent receptor [Spirosoma sordidisoli]
MKNTIHRCWVTGGMLLSSTFVMLPAVGLADTPSINRQVAVTVSGQVNDDQGNALPGVNILLKGTSQGTTTNAEGRFSLTIPDGRGTLVFSYIGYLSQEVPVNNRSNLTVTLQNDTKALSEVIVIGYGTVKKSDLTGSVASVGSKELKAFPIASVDQALSARATGINVTQASGAPGGGVTVRIRGANSINAGSEPLYVIDGFPIYPDNGALSAGGNRQPTNALASINPSDIESVEILKDASATSIYGSRGANGVVLITTKRGKAGSTRIDYDGSQSVQSIAREVKVLNAADYARYQNLRALSRNQTIPYPNPEQYGEGTNWMNEITRAGAIANHNLTLSGGNEKTQFAVAGGYFRNDGVVKNSYFERYSLRLNVDSRFLNDKMRVGTSTTFSRSGSNAVATDRGGPGGSAIITALGQSPLGPVYNASGGYDLVSYDGRFLTNPLAQVLEPVDADVQNRILSNNYVQAELAKGLSLRSSIGFDVVNTNRTTFYNLQTVDGRNSGGSLGKESRYVLNFLNENILSYNRQLGENQTIDALVGYTYQTDNNQRFGTSTQGFTVDDFQTARLQDGLRPQIPYSYRDTWALKSFLARVNYNLLGRYLFTLTLRRDGSSRFGENNKWANFPSVALGWRIKDESFMQDIKAVSEAKLRASYGITGNSNIPTYRSLAALSTTNYLGGSGLLPGLAESRVANPNLKWETTAMFNVGLDLGLFSNRLNVTADYFYNKTTDLLLDVALPTSTGFSTSFQNAGSLRNTGFELALNGVIINNRKLRWDATANVSFVDNKILDIGPSAPFYAGSPSGHLGVDGSYVAPGLAIGSWYGYHYIGLFQSTQEIASSPSIVGDKPGYPRYQDVNGDGTITQADRTYLGNPNPKMIWGFNTNLTYGAFDLNLFLRGTQGNKVRNLQQSEMADGVGNYNQAYDILTTSWTPENPNATRPVIDATRDFANYFRRSDFFIEDGSFIRLQNISLGYRLPQIKSIRNARIYVSGQNVFLITKYRGFDPEVNNQGQSSLNRGDDYDAYPRPRTLTLGLQIGL